MPVSVDFDPPVVHMTDDTISGTVVANAIVTLNSSETTGCAAWVNNPFVIDWGSNLSNGTDTHTIRLSRDLTPDDDGVYAIAISAKGWSEDPSTTMTRLLFVRVHHLG